IRIIAEQHLPGRRVYSMEGLQACTARMCVSQLTATYPAPWYAVSVQRWLLGPLRSRSGDPPRRPSRLRRSAQKMPSTLPPLDAAGEWGRQGEPAARIAFEPDPLRQGWPPFVPTTSRPLLPGEPPIDAPPERQT